MRRDVAEVNVEAMFPEQFAGVSVETHQPFLLRLARAGGVLQVHMIADDDRRRATTVWSFPGEILSGWRPLGRKIRFSGDAVAGWSTPIRPVTPADDGGESKTKVQINGDQVSHFGGPPL